jgi:transposase-like protein
VKVIFRDKEYQTLARCYRDNKDVAKVSLSTFVKRVGSGDSIEEALTEKAVVSFRGSHIVEGVEYKNLPSIARAYGINEATIYRRYYNGKRGDDLVPPKKRRNYVPPEPKKPANQIEIGGVTYKSIPDACRTVGIKHHTYKNRRRKGCTPEQCLGIEPVIDGRKARAKTIEYKGELLTFNDIEKRFGLYSSTFLGRLKRGWSIEKALTTKSTHKNKLNTLPDD